MRPIVTNTLLIFGTLLVLSESFVFTVSRPVTVQTRLTTPQQSLPRLWSSTSPTLQDLSEPEQRVYSLIESLHSSGFTFRIVVVGTGAILEATSVLGPVMKLNTSPKTGETLVTLASQDQSFELHLKPSQVSKVILTEKETGDKMMRIIRFLTTGGDSLCSLILSDDSEYAVEWFKELRSTYGEDLQL